MPVFYLDSGNMQQYQTINGFVDLQGITTNPSIVAKEGLYKKPAQQVQAFLDAEKDAQKLVHYQLVGHSHGEMMSFYQKELSSFKTPRLSIKITGGVEGLKTIRALSSAGHLTTATGLYTAVQGMMAIEAGADFVVLYINRIAAEGNDPSYEVDKLRNYIEIHGSETQILAASFKNTAQIMMALSEGAHLCTVAPELLLACTGHPFVQRDTEKFYTDWQNFQ